MNFIEIDIDISPFETFVRLSEKFDDIYILESILGPEKLSEFSYIGFNPSLKVTLENNIIKVVNDGNENSEDVTNSNDLFNKLREILKENQVKNDFNRLIGGLVGYISYDIVRNWEKISEDYTKLEFADFQFGLFNEGIIFDHEKNKSYYYYSEQNNMKDILELLTWGKRFEDQDLTSTGFGNQTVSVLGSLLENQLEKNLKDSEFGKLGLVDDIAISGAAGLLQGADEDFEVTAKRQIGDKTFLNLSYKRSFSLTNPNQSQIGVEYKLNRHFSVVGNIDEYGNLNLKYRYRYAY